MESPLRAKVAMGHAEPESESISAGPHEPPARERPVAQEPTVVVAWGVQAYDDRGPVAAPLAPPPASDPSPPVLLNVRPPALTMPPERELTAAVRQARLQSRLLTVAALLLFASAGLVVKGALEGPLESSANASTTRSVHESARPIATERVPEPVVTTAAMAPLPEPVAPAPPGEVAPPAAPVEELDALAKPARPVEAHRAPAASAARRGRPIKKTKPEIVRESPF
jgi:hypothetical protein